MGISLMISNFCDCNELVEECCNSAGNDPCTASCCGREENFSCVYLSNHEKAYKYATRLALEATNWMPTGGVTYGSVKLWMWLLNSTNGNVTAGNWAVYGGAGLVSAVAFGAITASVTYSCTRWSRGVCWERQKEAYEKV